VRILKCLVAVSAAAAAATALAAAPALAEPINNHGKLVEPAAYDVVGVGSDTTQYVVDQLSLNYNATVKKHSPTNPYIYGWDAVPPSHPLDTTQAIKTKAGCKTEPRPDGSSAGIAALTSYGNVKYKGKTYPCIDFARSSRPRKSTDGTGPGGVVFVTLAGDAVTYASASKTNVPNNLSEAQLQKIFGCSIPAAHGFAAGTWGALLGATAKDPTGKPDPIVPQAGSGTLSFWMETALGFTGDSEPTCGSAANLSVAHQPEENEGISPVFLVKSGGKEVANPNVIYPFSVGSFVAQAYHSKVCGHSAKKGDNKFGCDETGIFHLDGISRVAPTVKSGKSFVTNPAWNKTVFHRFLYDVVPFYSKTSDHVSPKLAKFFGPKGYFCGGAQKKVLIAYGFEPTLACGVAT
jgi:ABC-type phosphate transport system substrate-binding protein